MMHRNRKWIFPALLAVLVIGGYITWRIAARSPFPPASNVCFGMLTSSLESAKTNHAVIVPDFTLDAVKHVECRAVPGMTVFEISGIDAHGKDFTVYETTGGKAASGADSVFDYCYLRDGVIESQTRITGREGKQASSSCAYDASLVPDSPNLSEYEL